MYRLGNERRACLARHEPTGRSIRPKKTGQGMSKYDDLPREQLIELLKKRDRTKKLGLVWERDEIEADNAVDANFVAATIIPDLSDKPAPWRNACGT